MSLAQCQQLLLDRRLGLIGMSNRRTAAIFEPRFPLHLATPQPLIAALPRDLVNPAQRRHRPLTARILPHKLLPLVLHATRSPGHGAFLQAFAVGTKVSTMCPVCSVNHVPGLYQKSAQPGRAGDQSRNDLSAVGAALNLGPRTCVIRSAPEGPAVSLSLTNAGCPIQA